MNSPFRKVTEADIERLNAVKRRILSAAQDEIRTGEVRPDELLAIFGFATGAVIAMQDQTVVSPKLALDLVMRNIRAGNDAAVEEMLGNPQGSA